jgi:hypothetical protein
MKKWDERNNKPYSIYLPEKRGSLLGNEEPDFKGGIRQFLS